MNYNNSSAYFTTTKNVDFVHLRKQTNEDKYSPIHYNIGEKKEGIFDIK